MRGDHAREDLLGRHALHELVGVGEEIALEALRARRRASAGRRDRGRRAGCRRPRPAAPPPARGRARPGSSPSRNRTGCWMHACPPSSRPSTASVLAPCGTLVLAGLEAARAARATARTHEAEPAPDHARLVETPGHCREAQMGGNLHDPRTRLQRRRGGEDPERLRAPGRRPGLRSGPRRWPDPAPGGRAAGSAQVLRNHGRSIMISYFAATLPL